jgi:AraC-like DNA-binding protein
MAISGQPAASPCFSPPHSRLWDMDFVSTITILGIVQGLYLGTMLLTMRGPNRRANRFLGLLLFAYSVSITHFFFLRIGAYRVFPDLVAVSFPALFLFGPLFYFYVLVLTDRTHQLNLRDILHAIPFLLMMSSVLPLHFLPAAEKLAFVARVERQEVRPIDLVLNFVQILQLACYLVAAHLVLVRYEKQIRSVRSSIEQFTLLWLRGGIFLYVAVFGVIFVLGVMQMAGYEAMPVYSVLVPTFVTVIIFTLGAFGLRQPEIFVPAFSEVEKEEKYQKSAMTPEKRTEYLDRLNHTMENGKPYRDPELTLPGLAQILAVPVHQLSQLLNETVGQSFFDYVNKARVEEAKKLLVDPAFSSYTILAIATEAGFNSKTAFNTAFKKHAGNTPSAFRKSVASRDTRSSR